MSKVSAALPPVLVVLIGWARQYDGTEAIVGGHAYLKNSPEENGELLAFVRQDDGRFHCGAGKGEIRESRPDVVFVARNPDSGLYEVVAVYVACELTMDQRSNWCTVKSRKAICFAVGKRPICSSWPAGQGMRRWANRVNSRGAEHPELLAVYRRSMGKARTVVARIVADVDPELSAFEGVLKERFILHRKREATLRAAKIRQALVAGNGHLVCEVPNCGFDFMKRYGELGRNFAVVHHLRPLMWAPRKGAKTSLDDLAIVCANCHQMIHRGGDCRELDGLIDR